MTRPLLVVVLACAASSCVAESGSPALRETLPNGALLVRYPDLPAIDDTVPEVAEPRIDLQFGHAGTDDPNLVFGEVRGIQAASDGTMYVLDFQATEVRVYDPEGQYLRTIARQGEGPGEVAEANGIILSGDTLLWMNNYPRGVIVGIDLDGVELRRFNKPVRSWGYIWDGVFDRRGRYWRATGHSDEGPMWPPRLGLSSTSWRYYYKSHDLSTATVDSVFLRERSVRSYRYEDSNGLPQFLPILHESFDMVRVNPSGGFWRANTAEYRIARTGEGGDTLVVIEAGLPELPVTDRDRSDFVEQGVESWGAEIRAELEEVAALMPDVKPILAGMFVDDEGVLWVRRVTPTDAPAFYDRYTEDGDYLGSVRLAFMSSPASRMWIQHGTVYGRIYDEAGIPSIVRVPFS